MVKISLSEIKPSNSKEMRCKRFAVKMQDLMKLRFEQ